MSLFDRAAPRPGGYREVSVHEAREGLRGVRFVDVREPAEFTGELGHAPGAELVPLAIVPLRASEWSREEPIAVICRSGGRSAQAATALSRLGFTRVINVAGGMLAWRANGLPVEF